VLILYLPLFQCEVAGVALAGEVVTVGMTAAASIGAGVWHLASEEAVMTGNSAPARCRDRTEVVGRFTVGGKVVVPRAIRAMLTLFEFLLGQGVVGGILAIPRDSAARSSSQPRVGSRYDVGVVRRSAVLDAPVSPCQFASLIVLIHQSQESFSCVGPDKSLADRFGSSDVGELVDPKLSPPPLCVGLQSLNFLETEGQFALVGFKIPKADNVRFYPVVP
jgi:hypothetical protein